MTRLDAAVNDAMEGEHASPDPSRCCVTSFGGAASPDKMWGESASPAQAGEDSIDAAVLQQIVHGVRGAQQDHQPWWIAAADGAPTDRTGQRRAGKHARVGSGERSVPLASRTLYRSRHGALAHEILQDPQATT